MTPGHIGLATLVATVWGLAFVVSKVGLDSFSPPLLTALRFAIAALAVFWIPRPAVSWPMLVGIGLTLYAGQFLLQFFGIAGGVPPGLTAFVVQTQALFTMVLAALVLGDRPSPRQISGILIALAGLALIMASLGGGATAGGLLLTLGSAISWAIGNVLVKRLPDVEILPLVAWASLVPPLPALALSLVLDGPEAIVPALSHASWASMLAVLYLGALSTIWGYAAWGGLLQRYPAGAVAPFALLAPIVGAIASALALGERFGMLRLSGMAVILVGVGVVALPLERWRRLRERL